VPGGALGEGVEVSEGLCPGEVDPAFAPCRFDLGDGDGERLPAFDGAGEEGGEKGVEEVVARAQALLQDGVEVEPSGSCGGEGADELGSLRRLLRFRSLVAAWVELPLAEGGGGVDLGDEAGAGAVEWLAAGEESEEAGAAHGADCEAVGGDTERIAFP
jgi:hypothetical protein